MHLLSLYHKVQRNCVSSARDSQQCVLRGTLCPHRSRPPSSLLPRARWLLHSYAAAHLLHLHAAARSLLPRPPLFLTTDARMQIILLVLAQHTHRTPFVLSSPIARCTMVLSADSLIAATVAFALAHSVTAHGRLSSPPTRDALAGT